MQSEIGWTEFEAQEHDPHWQLWLDFGIARPSDSLDHAHFDFLSFSHAQATVASSRIVFFARARIGQVAIVGPI